MSVFTNNTNAQIIVDGPTGKKYSLAPGDVLEGSNFFKRYVGTGLLTLTTDDGSVWVDGDAASGKVARSSSVSVGGSSGFDDNELDYEALIGGPASYLQITCESGAVQVRINEDADSDFTMAANDIQRFDTGDLLVNKVQFSTDFSGGSAAVLSVIATGKPV